MSVEPLEYRYPVGSLRAGSSLGNPCAFARLDGQTDCKGLWCSLDNQFYAGQWIATLERDGVPLTPQETVFRPASQSTIYTDGKDRAEKEFLLPFLPAGSADGLPAHLRAAIMIVRIRGRKDGVADVRVRHALTFPAVESPLFTKRPPETQMSKKVSARQKGEQFEILTVGAPSQARLFGSPGALPRLIRADDRRLEVEYRFSIAAGSELTVPFVLAFSPEGIISAMESYRHCTDVSRIEQETREAMEEILSRSLVVTPDPVINRALQWAKVNMVRVQHRYRSGLAFTNDPLQDIVVVRDLAWYILGSDYLTPDFSRGMIAFTARHAFEEGGKLTEYLHADEQEPAGHDYGLTMNDDTPLSVWALFHHAAACSGPGGAVEVFPLMRRACDWIISQTEGGLVRARASGTGLQGIAGWRNIIEGYNLSGAVTEINAECYFALQCTADCADWIGDHAAAGRYRERAASLKEAINAQLVSEKTGMYLLAIAGDGTRRHDVTGDLVFPLMFGLAEGEVKGRILEALTAESMWTPFGSRSVDPQEENFDPDAGYQLLGGIWPNLTAWIAYAIRKESPGKLVEGMKNIYRLSEAEHPAAFTNVVPGQFPERLHGTTFESRGMSLSPWTPPTYLWLGIEGLLGFEPAEGAMNPSIPRDWKWIAVKDLLYRGERITVFMVAGELYSTQPLRSAFPVQVGSLLPASPDDPAVVAIALAVDGDLVLFAGAQEEVATVVTVLCGPRTIGHSVKLRAGEAMVWHLTGVTITGGA